MTALRLEAPPARIRNGRVAHAASQRRIARNARNRYAAVAQITFGVAIGLAVLLSYVLLVANITALSYSVDRAHEQRSEMQAQVARYDDEISSLTSDDRLAAVAARLHMAQPDQFVRVSLSPPAQNRPLAFLSR